LTETSAEGRPDTQEVQRLFQELDANRNVQVGQVIRLLLYTGARKREILDAHWDEIDFDRQILTVPAERSKSKKPRHIPLSDAAVELLHSLPRRDDIPWVFFNPRTGKPPVSIFYAWDSIREKVGLKEVRLHDLRHSYASFLVNAGRSLYEVQKLLGHQDPKVTMRYAHLSPQAMREAVNIVGSIVGRPPAIQADTTAPLHVSSPSGISESLSRRTPTEREPGIG
jgi:integrase